MKKLSLPLILLVVFLASCASTVPKPAPPPAPSVANLEEPVIPSLLPSPISLNNQTYYPDTGVTCLFTKEKYSNTKGYFDRPTISSFFEEFLVGMGYQVIMNPESVEQCELIVDLSFEIELLSAKYRSSLAPPGVYNECYTGIDAKGSIDISFPKSDESSQITFGFKKEPPELIDLSWNQCYGIGDNPLVKHWTNGYDNFEFGDDYLSTMLDRLWGTRAAIAILGINGELEGLDTLQSQASYLLRENKISGSDFEYFIRAMIINPSKREIFLNLFPSDNKSEIGILVLLSYFQNEEQGRFAIKELNLLNEIQLDEKYVNVIPPILISSFSKNYEDKLKKEERRELSSLTNEIIASFGPDVIPYAVWYFYHNNEVSVLEYLARNGYSEQVAQQAGAYLSYTYFLMDKGELPYSSKAIPNLLADLFPDVVNGEGWYTKPIRFYRAWEKLYGEN